MPSSSTEEWRQISQIFLTLNTLDGHVLILDGMVEAKGEARRVMVRPSRHQERTVFARWRDAVPSSVRIMPSGGMPAGHKTQFERQLLAYAAGTDPLKKPEPGPSDRFIDTREPESKAEDLRWA